MKRNIPDPNNHLISFFIDRQKTESSFEEKYEALMINTEKSLEKKLIDLFSNLGILPWIGFSIAWGVKIHRDYKNQG